MKMNFTVGMGRNESLAQVPELAQVAEECGFSHMTFIDAPFLARDPYVMMSLAATSTSRIRIGPGVVSPVTYHPITLANAIGSIDELSGGRAFLGLGVGQFSAAGMRPVTLGELRRVIEFARNFMAGEEAEWKGSKVRSDWIKRPVPIYIASAGPRSLQLAGAVADGVICYGVHPVMWKWYLEHIERGVLSVGRDPSSIDTWARSVCCIANSKEEARPQVASYNTHTLAQLYGNDNPDVLEFRRRLEQAEPGIFDESQRVLRAWNQYDNQRTGAPHGDLATQRLIDLFALSGRPEEICERIQQLGEVGVSTTSMVTYTIEDKSGMMRQVAKAIMPRFNN